MKSTQTHLKSFKIDEIYTKPVLANEREARTIYHVVCAHYQRYEEVFQVQIEHRAMYFDQTCCPLT